MSPYDPSHYSGGLGSALSGVAPTTLGPLLPARQGVKYDQGKIPWHMLPRDALEEVIAIFQMGAAKYGEGNWLQGLPWLRVWDAAQRHLWAWRSGEDLDPESGRSHLAHAAWNCLALLHYLESHPELDDRKGAADAGGHALAGQPTEP